MESIPEHNPEPKPLDHFELNNQNDFLSNLTNRVLLPVSKPTSSSFKFSISSYNILAEAFTLKLLFYWVDSIYRKFEYRSKRTILELTNDLSDIICLQELDHYEDFYKNQFESLDYESIFHEKGRKGRYRFLKGGVGCLVSFSKKKFDLVEVKKINYDDYEDIEKTSIEGIIVTLKNKSDNQKIIVANTHTHWHSKDDHVQFGQICHLIDEIKIMQKKFDDKDKVPVFICGDFNVEPKSVVLQYLKTPNLSYEKNVCFLNKLFDKTQKLSSYSKKYINPFIFKSAYDDYLSIAKNNGLEVNADYCERTHNHKYSKRVIDYILFCGDNVGLTDILELPNKRKLGENCPNECFPSDHIRIKAVFEMK